MKLGISTASLYPLETEKALTELCKSGVKYTEIFSTVRLSWSLNL